MKRWLAACCSSLTLLAPVPAAGQTPQPAPAAPLAGEKAAVARAVATLAEGLKKHPAQRVIAAAGGVDRPGNRLPVYMMDLEAGGTTLIADEPDPDFVYCTRTNWSQDGTRIAFDARPSREFAPSRLKLLTLEGGRPKLADVGAGACPTLSPDGKRVAFLFDEPGDSRGVWLMNLDGTGKRHVSNDSAAPFWSPDGREFLLSSLFVLPTESTVIDVDRGEGGVIEIEGEQIFSWPSWAGPRTLVAALGPVGARKGGKVALLDVSRPAETRVVEVLWERGDGDNTTGALWPVYWPPTGRCYFVGEVPGKRTLLTVERGKSKVAKAVEGTGFDDKLGGLSISPDGRYLLFCADRPAPKENEGK